MRKFFNEVAGKIRNIAGRIKRPAAVFSAFAKKPPVVRDEFIISDLTWHLATYARRGDDYSKTVTDDKGNSASYRVDCFKDGVSFDFGMTIIRDGKTYQTTLTAEKTGPHRAKITSFVLDNHPEALRTRKETFNALNHLVNNIRAMELGQGRVPEPHQPKQAPFNKLSRWMIRLTR